MTIIMVAIATLATSCKVSDGENYTPMDIGKAIAHDAHEQLSYHNFDIRLALMCDRYITTEDEATRAIIYRDFIGLYGYQIVYDSESGDITITSGSQGWVYIIFHTGGTPLSEGGTWTTTTNGHNQIFTATDEGVMVTANIPEDYPISGKYEFLISNISFDIVKGLSYNMDGFMDLTYYSGNASLYMVTTDTLCFSTEPNKNYTSYYKNGYKGFYDGAMDVTYNDTHTYNVKMSYINSDSIRVKYLGGSCTITNIKIR
jgi:hypothetical protein